MWLLLLESACNYLTFVGNRLLNFALYSLGMFKDSIGKKYRSFLTIKPMIKSSTGARVLKFHTMLTKCSVLI